jgi:hypothetical protein
LVKRKKKSSSSKIPQSLEIKELKKWIERHSKTIDRINKDIIKLEKRVIWMEEELFED